MSILSSVPGVRFYVRGLDLGTAGSNITTWADQSGLGNDVTKVAAGTAPTVAGASTPSGAKSARWGASSERLEAATTPFPLTAMASSTFSGYSAAAAFDGNAGTYWASSGANPATTPQWVRINWWSAGRTLTSYGITPRATGEAPSTFKFQGSNDGNTWTDLDTRSGISWPSTAKQTFTFSNSTAYKCYRLYVTAAVSAGILVIDIDLGAGNTPDAALTEGEFWALIKVDSGQHEMFANTCAISGDAYYPYADGNIYWTFLNPNRPGFTPTLAPTSWRIVRLSHGSGVSRFFIDGVQQQTQTVTPDFPPTFWIGQGNRSQYFSNANIAAFLVLDHVATSGEITTITNEWTADYLSTGSSFSSTPPAGALTISGTAPSVSSGAGASIAAVAGALVLAATAPAVSVGTGVTIAPPAGSLTISATAPSWTVTADASIAAPAGSLAISATAPAVYGAASADVSAPAGALSISATAPNVSTLGSVAVVAPAGALTISATAPVVVGNPVAEPWTLDRSQLDLATISDVQGVALVDYPAAPIPATLASRVRPLRRNSPILDVQDVTAGAIVKDGGYWRGDGTHEVIREDVGYLHVWVDGVDVTYWNDTVTEVGSVTSSTPGGEESLTLRFPWLTSLDYVQAPPHFWLRADVDVDVKLIDMEGVRHPIWSGHLVADSPRLDEGSDPQVWEAHGALTLADVQMHQQPIMMGPTDIGAVIPDELNAVVSRSYNPIPRVTTGIMTRSKGAASDTRWGYANGLLGTAWTEDERQWSIVRHASLPRTYRMQLRDEAVSWTLTSGAPGVSVDLTKDSTQRIDRVFGRGVGPDGYSWQNRKFPNLLAYAMPDYPFTNPSNVITVGTTDAGTDSGNGVTTWQRRMVEAGCAVTIDGVYSSSDASWARKVQKDAGISVDGVVGPQTWAATFDVGTTGADLNGSYRAPLFQLVAVTPNLYAANGKVIGENPDYDPLVKPKDQEVVFAPGIDKVQATRFAVDMVQRSFEVGWVGTITLHGTDPAEGSKWFMREGQNVLLKHWRGNTDRPLHIVSVEHDFTSDTTTLRVDSKNRDALSAHEIYMRNKESAPDPARRPGTTDRRSRQEQDQVVPFEGESEAGYVYLPTNGDAGLWSVRPVFVSEIGQLVKVDLRATPHREFAVVLFGDEVTPNDLARWMPGGPFVSDPEEKLVLADGTVRHAYIESWGNPTEKAGRSPKGTSVTGWLLDDQVVNYVSAKGGWVWVATYATASTIIEGRLYPAPVI